MIRKYPFEFHRTGWGTFDIPITIHFKKRFKMGHKSLEHELNFNKKITQKYFTIKIPKDILKNIPFK